MEDNSLLMIILAFILGYMCSAMMKQMCGGRLVEGKELTVQGDQQCTMDGFNINDYKDILSGDNVPNSPILQNDSDTKCTAHTDCNPYITVDKPIVGNNYEYKTYWCNAPRCMDKSFWQHFFWIPKKMRCAANNWDGNDPN